MTKFKHSTILITLALLLIGCGSVETKSTSGTPPISDYFSGYFFDATISGLNVIPMQNKASKTKIKKYFRADDVRWQLDGKVVGGITVAVRENARSRSTIGTLSQRPKITFIPLEGQKKSTYRALSKSKDVLVDGSGVVSVKKYATDNRLPSGAYIIRIKVQGTENWDRKEVYIEVNNK